MAEGRKDKESPWFRHDCDADQDPKMERLLAFYGNAGVGVYWRLAQRMRLQGGRLNRSDIPVLAVTLAFPELPKLIEDGCGDEWQLYHRDKRYFWSDRSVSEAQIAAESRGRASAYGKLGAERRWRNSPPNGTPNSIPNGVATANAWGHDGTDRPTDLIRQESSEEDPTPLNSMGGANVDISSDTATQPDDFDTDPSADDFGAPADQEPPTAATDAPSLLRGRGARHPPPGAHAPARTRSGGAP